MVAVMALMEFPAIMVGVMLIRKFEVGDAEGPGLRTTLRHAVSSGSVLMIMGSLLIGMLADSKQASSDTSWTQPWGEWITIRDHHNELKLVFREKGDLQREMDVTFRLFDDGVAFRYSPDGDGGGWAVDYPQADRNVSIRLAEPLVRAGYTLAATPGTRAALADLGIPADPARPLGASERDDVPGIAELIRSGAVAVVVNTPSMAAGALRDALEIRLAAVEFGVLCLTAMETAVASAEALAIRTGLRSATLDPIGERGLR